MSASTPVPMDWSTTWPDAVYQPTAAEMKKLDENAVDVIKGIQHNLKGDDGRVYRAQHAKTLFATTEGQLRVPLALDTKLAFGPFQPGANLRAIVRISSVAGVVQDDNEKDLRGIAIRLTDDNGHRHDILLNTSEEFMAPDATITLIGAAARGHTKTIAQLGSILGSVLSRPFSMLPRVGEVIDLIKRGKAVATSDISLAAHTFWSRTPFQLGDYAVKIRLAPKAPPADTKPMADSPNELTEDIAGRLATEPIVYELQVQGYIDETKTPMNDARKKWDSPGVTVGDLTLPALTAGQFEKQNHAVNIEVENVSFNPFNRWDESAQALNPVGEINAVRKIAYEASVAGRSSLPGANAVVPKCPYGFGG